MGKRRAQSLVFIVVCCLWSACDRGQPVTSPVGSGLVAGLGSSFADSARDVPESEMTLPPHARPFDTDDAALEDAIRSGGGLAFIAFKSPSAARAFEARGRRGAVPAVVVRQALRVLERSGVELLSFYASAAIAHVRLAPGVVASLRQSPFVDFVEPAQVPVVEASERVEPVRRVLTSAPWSASSGQVVPWNVSQINAPGAWALSSGAAARVMMLGWGIRSDPDFPAIPGGNCGGAFGSCSEDYSYDGVMMAGIMIPRDNSIGIVGVAPGIQGSNVYVWKAYGSADHQLDMNLVVAGINEAALRHIPLVILDAVHLDYNAVESAAIGSADAAGTLFVSGVGILGQYYERIYPASYKPVIGVSGVRPDGVFAAAGSCVPSWSTGSNYGPFVQLAAPASAHTTFGSGYYSDLWQYTPLPWCNSKLAAAHVAGTVMLMQSLHPEWDRVAILGALRNTASGGGTRIDDRYGYGVINAAAAVANSPPPPPPPPSLPVTISGASSVRPYAACNWYGFASGGTEPYAFTWYVDGAPAGDGSGTLSYPNFGNAFTITLHVTDATGRQGANLLSVTVDSDAMECLDW